VATCDKHRVHGTHSSRITRNTRVCPAEASHVIRQRPSWRGYSAGGRGFSVVTACPAVSNATARAQPWRTQLMAGSPWRPWPSPSSGRCWQSHQVPPGQSSWCRPRQCRQIILPLLPRCPRAVTWPGAWPGKTKAGDQCPSGSLVAGYRGGGSADAACPLLRYRKGQAALARRILRRRSAERSSSFSPPQVPYFSGRATA
jgi:hypothetical protein